MKKNRAELAMRLENIAYKLAKRTDFIIDANHDRDNALALIAEALAEILSELSAGDRP